MIGGDGEIDIEQFGRLTDLEIDDTYRLLADERTRITIRTLAARDDTIALDDLTEVVRTATDSHSGAQETRLSLAHVVLPKLEAYGVTRYEDEGSRTTVDPLGSEGVLSEDGETETETDAVLGGS